MKPRYTIMNEYTKKGETFVNVKVTTDGFVSYGQVKKGSKKYLELFPTTTTPRKKPDQTPTAVTKPEHEITKKMGKYSSIYEYKYRTFGYVIQNIKEIFREQKRSFKININFVFRLKNRVTNETRELNKNITDKPATITNKSTLDNYIRKLQSIDLVERFSRDRPDSKFQFDKYLRYAIKLTYLNSSIGCKISLPDYIKNKRNIVGLENYADNLCFWRCLAIYKFNSKPDKASLKARGLFRDYYKHKDYKKYAGVNLSELPLIEEHFSICINVFQFISNDTTEIFMRSKNNFTDELNVNLYKNHFSLIRKLNTYIKHYNCTDCDKVFDNLKALSKHSKQCSKGETTFKFPGGLYKPNQNIFERIDKLGVYVDQADRYNPYFICYDFEAMLQRINEVQKNTSWTSQHVPISVSICSNIPNYTEPICIVNEDGNVSKFINEFVQVLIKISNQASVILKPKYKETFSKLTDIVDKKKKDSTKYKYKFIVKQLEDFIHQIPVVGFNSGKYDLNLIKHDLFDALMSNDQGINFSVKKSNSFMCIGTNNLKFLDILNYLAPGYSYDSFLKAYECKLQKAVFCYEYLDDLSKLKDTALPAYEKWFSKLRNKNISKVEYEQASKVWKDNNMQTLKDYLIYYNNLDVLPFVEAIEKMKDFYKNKQLDMFKDGLSIPGLANKYMFNSSEDAHFELFGEDNKDLFFTFKSNMVGGPSIIFNRYQEANKTKIKNNKMCQKVIGFDANALYLGCIGGVMPTRSCKRYEPSASIAEYCAKITDGSLFGFVELDIETPEELKEKFKEFPPIFKNTVLSYHDLPEGMQKYKEKTWKSKSLVSSYYGRRILLYTPLIQFYLKHGLKITKIYQIVEYHEARPFERFVEEVCDARRTGDKDKSKAIISESMKLLGNSAFGRTILDKTRFNNVQYKSQESEILKSINNAFFKDINEINGTTAEITSNKTSVTMDVPIQIGLAIFSLAKLRMLEFQYDFLMEYVRDEDYQMVEMDTDSNYMAISAKNFEDIIRPEKKEQYETEKHNWFVTTEYDRRKPGLFKIEYEGSGIVALNSKCYYCKGEYDKLSSKGVQKSNNLTFEDYKSTLFDGISKKCLNRGFRVRNNKICSYESEKVGLTPFYAKRVVLSNGIDTRPLDI